VLVLTVLSITSVGLRSTFIQHSSYILLLESAVYAYRDVWPLAKRAGTPVDIKEGWILWARVAVLGFTAILIPLFTPQVYKPLDPKVCASSRVKVTH